MQTSGELSEGEKLVVDQKKTTPKQEKKKQNKKKTGPPRQKENEVLRLSLGFSSLEAAVVVKLFGVDCSVSNALSTSNTPNTSF